MHIDYSIFYTHYIWTELFKQLGNKFVLLCNEVKKKKTVNDLKKKKNEDFCFSLVPMTCIVT